MPSNKSDDLRAAPDSSAVKEHPILFNGAMVRAILSGEKTQTRRPYKARKHPDFGCEMAASELVCESQHAIERTCPHGQPGERLWVRETFCKIIGQSAGWIATDYRATYTHGTRFGDTLGIKKKWTPSIHMPREASRILLEITAVRVERLQAITETDARSEGTEPIDLSGLTEAESTLLCGPLNEVENPYRNGYAFLWDSINGAGDWARNPWVWLVSFRRVDAIEQPQTIELERVA